MYRVRLTCEHSIHSTYLLVRVRVPENPKTRPEKSKPDSTRTRNLAIFYYPIKPETRKWKPDPTRNPKNGPLGFFEKLENLKSFVEFSAGMNETLTNHCLTPSKMPKNRPIIALHANDPCILGQDPATWIRGFINWELLSAMRKNDKNKNRRKLQLIFFSILDQYLAEFRHFRQE